MENGGAPRALILFGSPGSGKGTQAKLLQICLGAPQARNGGAASANATSGASPDGSGSAPHISTGDMLREHIQAGDALGQEVAAVMRAGMLVSDDLVNRLVEDRIQRPDSAQGFILDGYPRTLPQARVLGDMLRRRGVSPVVVHLKVDYNEIISRLSGRRQCPLCKTLYNLGTNPPKVDEICDVDGTGLVTRPDDSEAVIRQRLEEYEFQTRPLLDFFRSSGYPFHEVNGSGRSKQTIANEICSLVAGNP